MLVRKTINFVFGVFFKIYFVGCVVHTCVCVQVLVCAHAWSGQGLQFQVGWLASEFSEIFLTHVKI